MPFVKCSECPKDMLVTQYNSANKRTCYACQRKRVIKRSKANRLRKFVLKRLKQASDEDLLDEVKKRNLTL